MYLIAIIAICKGRITESNLTPEAFLYAVELFGNFFFGFHTKVILKTFENEFLFTHWLLITTVNFSRSLDNKSRKSLLQKE